MVCQTGSRSGSREALDVGAVGDRGEQVLGDLRLLVMRHPDARGAAEGGRAPPLGDAAALGGVEVDEVDGARVEEPPHSVARDLALARGDGVPRRLPDPRHHRHVVVPVAGLLEPLDVEGLDQPGEAHRVRDGPAAIGVDREDEIRPRRPARRLRLTANALKWSNLALAGGLVRGSRALARRPCSRVESRRVVDLRADEGPPRRQRAPGLSDLKTAVDVPHPHATQATASMKVFLSRLWWLPAKRLSQMRSPSLAGSCPRGR